MFPRSSSSCVSVTSTAVGICDTRESALLAGGSGTEPSNAWLSIFFYLSPVAERVDNGFLSLTEVRSSTLLRRYNVAWR